MLLPNIMCTTQLYINYIQSINVNSTYKTEGGGAERGETKLTNRSMMGHAWAMNSLVWTKCACVSNSYSPCS